MFWSRKTGWIGVDIGTCAVKLAQVERRGQRYFLRNAAIIPREKMIDTGGWIRSIPVSSSNEIREGRAITGFDGKDSACTIPLSVCDVRRISLAETSDMRSTVGEKLSEIHSVRTDNIHFDFWPSATSDSRDKNDYNVICQADRWTNQVLLDYRTAGLNCRVLDGVPFAIARACSMIDGFDTGVPYVAIDWGGSSTTVCAVAGSKPEFVRSLPGHGFDRLHKKIGSELGIQPSAVRKLCSEFGLANSREIVDEDVCEVVTEITSSFRGDLIEEIRVTLAHLHSRMKKIFPVHGIVMGAGATLKNVDAWLTDELRIPFSTWRISTRSTTPVAGVELYGPAVATSCLAWSGA
ncbi:MAG: hypothetical protein AAF456_13565 [Planctomycetota bacterium]